MIFVLIFGFCGFIGNFYTPAYKTYKFQADIIYSPNKPHRDINLNDQGLRNPGERDLDYEDISIRTSDKVKLHGWFIKQKNPSSCPTIVFFHGIDGNMGTRLPFITALHQNTKSNILIVSYRGYGFSEGSPSEIGIKRDIDSIIDYIFQRHDIEKRKVFIFGTSFGGATGIYASSISKVAGLIIENTFVSMDDIIDRKLKISLVRKLILRNNWRNIDTISKVASPILILTGKICLFDFIKKGLQDPMIPPINSQLLFDAAINSEFKTKHDFPEGKHKDIWKEDTINYFNTVNTFINKCLN